MFSGVVGLNSWHPAADLPRPKLRREARFLQRRGRYMNGCNRYLPLPLRTAEAYLKRWYFWATHSRLAPIVKVAHTIRDHWEGILRWFPSGLTTALLQGTNSLIKAAKARGTAPPSTFSPSPASPQDNSHSTYSHEAARNLSYKCFWRLILDT